MDTIRSERSCSFSSLFFQVLGKEPNQRGPSLKVSAKNIITCAGFYSDRVAGLTGGDASNARVVTFRGTYYQLKPEYRGIVRMNIYPVPSGGGIPVGVHLTPTVCISKWTSSPSAIKARKRLIGTTTR